VTTCPVELRWLHVVIGNVPKHINQVSLMEADRFLRVLSISKKITAC